MKTLLAVIFAIGFALIFERRRIAAFLAARRPAGKSAPIPDAETLLLWRRELQDARGLPHLALEKRVDGAPWRFLLAWSSGDLFLRASGAQVRYRFFLRNGRAPLRLDRATPRTPEEEHGPHQAGGWVFIDPSEGWAPVGDLAGQQEAARLFAVFGDRWASHIEPDLEARRTTEWRAMVDAIDQQALERLVTIFARDDPPTIAAAVDAARTCWSQTPWSQVPDTSEARTALWWWRVVDALWIADALVSWDHKGFEAFTQEELVVGLPALAAVAREEPQGRTALDRMTLFDHAIRPLGYRLLSPATLSDDYTGIVLTESLADEVLSLAAQLGVALTIAQTEG